MKKEMEKFIAETKKGMEEFNKAYSNYSHRRKVNHWLASIHSSMRTYGESIGDPYDLFTKKRYNEWKASEPDIDSILADVFPRLQLFDIEEFKKRIKQ